MLAIRRESRRQKFIAAGLGCRAQLSLAREERGIPRNARPNWREIIEAPKAVMAAASMDSTRSSAAMECFAHSGLARYRVRCSEEEEERRKKETASGPRSHMSASKKIAPVCFYPFLNKSVPRLSSVS